MPKKKKAKKEQVSSENVFHVKLDAQEAIRSRKDVLSTQMGLLKIAIVIKEYHELRVKELEIKRELRKKMRTLNTDISHLQRLLPELKIPKILQKEEEEYEEVEVKRKKLKKVIKRKYTSDIESQLQDIQDQLEALA